MVRILIYSLAIFISVSLFGWVGLLIGLATGFGFSLFRDKSVRIDHSKPFFAQTSHATLWDVHFFELFGYVCKIDGVVSRDEIQGVEVVFQHLGFSQSERQRAIERFNIGKQGFFELEDTLQEVSNLNLPKTEALNLIHLMNVVLSNSDGSGLIRQERELLFMIGRAFGLRDEIVAQVLLLSHGQDTEQQSYQHSNDVSASSLELAYETLGVSSDASEKEIERSYRRLRGKFHPDRLPKSASSAEHDAAEQRFTEIQRAWDIVRVQRGL